MVSISSPFNANEKFNKKSQQTCSINLLVDVANVKLNRDLFIHIIHSRKEWKWAWGREGPLLLTVLDCCTLAAVVLISNATDIAYTRLSLYVSHCSQLFMLLLSSLSKRLKDHYTKTNIQWCIGELFLYVLFLGLQFLNVLNIGAGACGIKIRNNQMVCNPCYRICTIKVE